MPISLMTKMKIRTSFPNQDIGIQCHTLCKHLLPSRKTGFHEVGLSQSEYKLRHKIILN